MAQNTPSFYTGQIPTANDWNSYFAIKADAPSGLLMVSGSSISPSSAQFIVVVNKTTGSATTVNLPSALQQWRRYTVKDGKGDAATNPITAIPAPGASVDGSTSGAQITSAYGSMDFVSPDGTNWNIV